MAVCPFGLDVGEPPSINACPASWTHCTCFRHMMGYAFGVLQEPTLEVVVFWQEHPNGFCEEFPE